MTNLELASALTNNLNTAEPGIAKDNFVRVVITSIFIIGIGREYFRIDEDP